MLLLDSKVYGFLSTRWNWTCCFLRVSLPGRCNRWTSGPLKFTSAESSASPADRQSQSFAHPSTFLVVCVHKTAHSFNTQRGALALIFVLSSLLLFSPPLSVQSSSSTAQRGAHSTALLPCISRLHKTKAVAPFLLDLPFDATHRCALPVFTPRRQPLC